MTSRNMSLPATVTTVTGEDYDNTDSIIFLREDLLERYLRHHKLDLVMLSGANAEQITSLLKIQKTLGPLSECLKSRTCCINRNSSITRARSKSLSDSERVC